METITGYLDIAGSIILFTTLVPIIKLMRELPDGQLRRRWMILVGFILFFLFGYISIAIQHHLGSGLPEGGIILYLLFFGAVFVLLVSILSLQTALDIKRIHTLEVENVTDPLMGIKNRRYLEKRLHEEFAKATRYRLPFSILMLDIDHFKKINDTYGHDSGDEVLKNLGDIIHEFIRETDCAARYGGEEIMIICPSTDSQHAAFLAERLRKNIEDRAIVPEDPDREIKEIRITVSIGIAEYGADTPDA
ncbi:MAG: GGDEF domain-containing protein, partial [Sulfurimonadaceae bacterium]|nr:GGDEF domain-containing protein [Sulfurimonadaceae bacterium]